MWFLLLQITALLLLATGFGAWLMWWWMSRRLETAAETRERLAAQASRIDSLPSRKDLEHEAGRLATAIAAIDQVDIRPLEERLVAMHASLSDTAHRLASLHMPEPDLTSVYARLDELNARLGALRVPEVDLGPVHSGIASLGLSLRTMEPAMRPLGEQLANLHTRFDELNLRIEASRQHDAEQLTARLTPLTQAMASLQSPDLGPLMTRLSEIQAAVANIPPGPSLEPVLSRIGEVHDALAAVRQLDLGPLRASLSDLETFVMALDRPPPDFTPLQTQLAVLEASLSLVHAEIREGRGLQSLDRRLASLQEAVGSLSAPDLGPLISAVRTADSRHDLIAMENRLTAIEYGLAALHHMLRSRSDMSRSDRDNRGSAYFQAVRDDHVVSTHTAVAARPERESDPVSPFVRIGDQANLLTEPAFGPGDDLQMIDGVGPMLRALLHDIGIYYFWQIAEWTPREIDWVENKLMHFKGRIRRDDWQGQARHLASLPTSSKRPAQGAPRKPV